MSKNYKKLIVLLIVLAVGFCLVLALGAAEQPSELTQEELNKDLVYDALYALSVQDVNRVDEFFDPNYRHHLHFDYYDTSLTLDRDEMSSWFHRDDHLYDYIQGWDASWGLSIYPYPQFSIAEGDKVAVRFHRGYIYDWGEPMVAWGEKWRITSTEIWILRIANGKLVEGWSAAEPDPNAVSQEDKNKALVKAAIHTYEAYRNHYHLPDVFDPNYIQHSPPADDVVLWEPKIWVFGSFLGAHFYYRPTVDFIIAEGDMVSVLVSWKYSEYQVGQIYYNYTQMGIFRIANGKIVEAWIAPAQLVSEMLMP